MLGACIGTIINTLMSDITSLEIIREPFLLIIIKLLESMNPDSEL